MHVDKELAISLKEIGYDKRTYTYYVSDEQPEQMRVAYGALNWNDDADFAYSAPTIDEAVNYLRDAHGLHITIDPTLNWDRWFITIHDKVEKSWSKAGFADTHHEALTAAAKKAIEIVKERKA